jgi:hypothetical protein
MGDQAKRNQPCPCGSGKKYKQCHLGKETPAVKRQRVLLPAFITLAGIGAAVAIAMTSGKIAAAIGFGFAGIILGGLVMVFRDPPPPDTSGKDPGAINFGG